MVTYEAMKAYFEACKEWQKDLKEYFDALPVDESVDIGSNPPPPPPPPPSE